MGAGWGRVPRAVVAVRPEQGEVSQHHCRHSRGSVTTLGCDGFTGEMDGGCQNTSQLFEHSTKRILRDERYW